MASSHRATAARWSCDLQNPLVRDVLQFHGGCGHLRLAQFRQEHIIHRELPAPGANDVLAEGRAHPAFVDSNLADIAVEFLPALLAFEVDRHRLGSFFRPRTPAVTGPPFKVSDFKTRVIGGPG
jgi:hypothetical protein